MGNKLSYQDIENSQRGERRFCPPQAPSVQDSDVLPRELVRHLDLLAETADQQRRLQRSILREVGIWEQRVLGGQPDHQCRLKVADRLAQFKEAHSVQQEVLIQTASMVNGGCSSSGACRALDLHADQLKHQNEAQERTFSHLLMRIERLNAMSKYPSRHYSFCSSDSWGATEDRGSSSSIIADLQSVKTTEAWCSSSACTAEDDLDASPTDATTSVPTVEAY